MDQNGENIAAACMAGDRREPARNSLRNYPCPANLTSTRVKNEPFDHIEYRFIDLPSDSETVAQDIAAFFIKSWMKNAHSDMLNLWQQWDEIDAEKRDGFHAYLEPALLNEGQLIDDPSQLRGCTGPIATFCETMLRWVRETYSDNQLVVYPPVPAPPGDGNIDLVEVTGTIGHYSSMRVLMWECKGSDGQAHNHNSKIYRQLSDYPRRLFPIANLIGEYYQGKDPATKMFLRDMATLARSRSSQVHFGAFIAHDAAIKQTTELVPHLHEYPDGHPQATSDGCHHLAVLLVPDFRNLRLAVWRALRFDPQP